MPLRFLATLGMTKVVERGPVSVGEYTQRRPLHFANHAGFSDGERASPLVGVRADHPRCAARLSPDANRGVRGHKIGRETRQHALHFGLAEHLDARQHPQFTRDVIWELEGQCTTHTLTTGHQIFLLEHNVQ